MLARLAEMLGDDHLWVYDHVVTALRRRPTHVCEALSMLTALWQRTTQVRLGQLVTYASYCSAGLLAKDAANVDVYSGSRLILGLGAGWFHEEYHAYGYEYPANRSRLACSTRRSKWSRGFGPRRPSRSPATTCASTGHSATPSQSSRCHRSWSGVGASR